MKILILLLFIITNSFGLITRFVNTNSTAGGDGTTNDTTGANRAYADLPEWEAAEQTVLTDTHRVFCDGDDIQGAGGLTVSGWTTTATNFILVTTDSANGRRHNGVVDFTKFVVADTNGTVLHLQEDFVRVDGLQVFLPSFTSGSGRTAIKQTSGVIATGVHYYSNNMIFAHIDGSGACRSGVGISLDGSVDSITTFVFNNIIYDFYDRTTLGCGHEAIEVSNGDGIIYNNTIARSQTGIADAAGADRDIYRNNLVQCDNFSAANFKDWSGLDPFDTTNNISSDATGPNVAFRNKLITFIDSANNDFRLAIADTQAIDSGQDLSADADLAFAVDIEGQARPQGNEWDIGADEQGGKTIIRFVNTASTSGGNGKTNDTVGVGRAYSSLNEWEAAEQRDLTTGPDTMKVFCDGVTADVANFKIDGWTTGQDAYIHILTTQDNRHNGIFDTTKYRLTVTQSGGDDKRGALQVIESHVRIEGLQITTDNSNTNIIDCIEFDAGGSAGGVRWFASYCIFKSDNPSNGHHKGISIEDVSNGRAFIFNNIIYDLPGPFGFGIRAGDAGMTSFMYNNTIINSDTGISVANGTMTVKNNIIQDCGSACYIGTFDVASTSNLTDDSTGPQSGPEFFDSLAFADSASDDFHLAVADTSKTSGGIDLSADVDIAFSDDIDLDTRSVWYVGADEFLEAVDLFPREFGFNRPPFFRGGTDTLKAFNRTRVFDNRKPFN